MKLPVPVTIVTGALGAGKTTAICHLLRSKQAFAPDETWAVLVNEFGALGIDASLMQGTPAAASDNSQGRGKVVVRELAGGCMCCSLSGPLGAAIAQLVRNAKPDRLIIEPSGLGHPAGLLDVLKGEHLKSALEVRAVICLVDCRQAAASDFAANTTYQDQVNVADVLVGAKTDLATEEQVQAFQTFAAELFPPKSRVLTTAHGALDPSLLDEPRQPAFTPWFTPAAPSRRAGRRTGAPEQAIPQAADLTDKISLLGVAAAEGRQEDGDLDAGEAEGSGRQWEQAQAAWSQGKPARFLSLGSTQHLACGWLFPPERVFDAGKLQQLLGAMAEATGRATPQGMGAAAAAEMGGRFTAAGGSPDVTGGGATGVEARAGMKGCVVVRAKGVFRVSAKSWVSMQLRAQAGSNSPASTSTRDADKAAGSAAGAALVDHDADSGLAGAGAVPGSPSLVGGRGIETGPGKLAEASSGLQQTGSAKGEGASLGGQGGVSWAVDVAPIAYRKDSRLEVILTRPQGALVRTASWQAAGNGLAAGPEQQGGCDDVQAAVGALSRQDWDAFERMLCACCT